MRRALLPWLALAGVVMVVHGRALEAAFVFDDRPAILENPSLRTLWPLSVPLSPPAYLPTAGRPLVNLSFAMNFRVGELDPLGYHLVNLALHAISAGLLFSLLRRAFASPAMTWTRRPPSPDTAATLAFAAALLWAVHPLQTEPIAYATQRTELMMGLFLLATLYASLRYWDAASETARRGWLVTAALSCAAGMASKENMAAAPLLVLLYDRTFRTGALREAWRSSRPLHVSLFLGWIVLFALNIQGPRIDTAGFHHGLPASDWWFTQAKVFWLYLKLVVWPWPLVIHYELPYLQTLGEAWPWVASTGLAAGLTALALWHKRASGFAWTWVFATLGPTLLVPIITEMAAERRMYMPLAAIAAWAVAGLYALVSRLNVARPEAVVVGAAVVLSLALGMVSRQRLVAYRDGVSIWADAVSSQPGNVMAHVNLGVSLIHAGRSREAITAFEQAIELAPGDMLARFNFANLLTDEGRLEEAIHQYRAAATIDPRSAVVQNNLAAALTRAGRLSEAVDHFTRAVELNPDDAGARTNLENVRALLATSGAPEQP